LSERGVERDTNQIKSPNLPVLPIITLAVASAHLPTFNFWFGRVALTAQKINKQTQEKGKKEKVQERPMRRRGVEPRLTM
jgi:membrane protein YqaA with SNARE-associated domain